jgi:hypothetical protein
VESLKIIAFCILAAIVYGIVHDQFTARICLEYFTVFHPAVFPTQSPTLLALGWGVVATWWVGAFLGILLSIAARLGPRPKATLRTIIRPVLTLLAVMALSATLFGVLGYFLGHVPAYWTDAIPRSAHQRFAADLWAHSASYATGFSGGLALCVIVYAKRGREHQSRFASTATSTGV